MIRWSTPGDCLWVGWTVSGDQMNNSRGLWVGWTVSGDQMIDSRGLTDGLGGLCQVIR